MDQTHFDALARTLSRLPSRRDLLRGLTSAGFDFGVLRLSDVAEAKTIRKKKKGKKKPKKKPQPQPQPQSEPPQPQPLPPLVFNEYGCIEVGQPCRGDSSQCCSGVSEGSAPAEGQQDQSRCVAHGLGTCPRATPGACTADNPGALRCNNEINCLCLRTTAGSNYCHDGNGLGIQICANCARDADCAALGYPPGSACAPISEGNCAGTCPGGMACLLPCGVDLSPD